MLNDGRIVGIKEPHEGHEELEAIPHAFAVEFNDGEDAWCMFCDTEEDKVCALIAHCVLSGTMLRSLRQDVLMSLLSKVAGL